MSLALTGAQLAALGEAFGIALGEAAAVFSQMVGEAVLLTVPSITLMPRNEVVEALGVGTRGGRVCSVVQHFEAESVFVSDTLLVFSEEGGLEVVRRLLNESVATAQIAELEQDALAEIGNIIINACMGSLANLLGREIPGGLPRVMVSEARTLFERGGPGDRVLVARIGLRLADNDVEGYVLFMMDLDSVSSFIQKVEEIFRV